MDTWNPMLIAIGRKHKEIVRVLFDKASESHKLNCLSKPYTLEE